ncbi:hypothetical protein ACA910_013326 [Epithemia clementina (nom. ined.)]
MLSSAALRQKQFVVAAPVVSQLWRRATTATAPAAARSILGRYYVHTVSTSRFFSTKMATKAAASHTAIFVPDMMCRQCEQTADHIACTTQGVCGKSSETSALQDTLLDSIKSLSLWCVAARATPSIVREDPVLEKANVLTLKATFSTLTNVNFSSTRIADYIRQVESVKDELKTKVIAGRGGESVNETEYGTVAAMDLRDKTDAELEEYGQTYSGLDVRSAAMNHDDAFSLNEIGTYGLKGVCAYASHVYQMVGKTDPEIMTAIHEIYAKLASPVPDIEGFLANALRVGQVNAQVLAALDGAHANTLGIPEPTPARTTAVEGKAILVSGHDMNDLYYLLQQTEGKGVNVYTHGEMLPAHSYPKLKAFPHLVGNYGTAWQNQKFEFASFPGPIVVTTNCILEPRRVYKDRLYSMNEVGLDGVQHIGSDRDFTAVIEQAQQMKGFPRDITPAKYHTTGFNHRAVLPLAGKVIEAAQSGALSRIFLIGGCDGSQWNRSYFTTLAEQTPDDSLILTMGCAKNRIIHNPELEGATLANGLPRVLDMGQCNDAYSAVVLATELAKAMNCSVNELPLSFAVSHLEQKAAAVILTYLSMGIKNIRLGPSLPAYITPNVLNMLVQKYNLRGPGDPAQDLQAMMEGK